MKRHEPGRGRVNLAGLMGLALAAALAVGLAGCAGQQTAGAGAEAKPDIVTASDESDARKRARTRLELAVGYFEQGQTTVALDELKQALAADPSYAEAFNLRGLVYMRLNDYRFAEESFRRALALNSRDPATQHNYGWLLCQQARYSESATAFNQVLAHATYGDRAKTFMALGLCQARAGDLAEAERNLARSYELDAGNPITGYNLANLLYQRGELERSQFYIRRINNSELANAETLWLGVKVERRMNNREAMQQLGDQLRRRFPQSRELLAYQRGAFDE